MDMVFSLIELDVDEWLIYKLYKLIASFVQISIGIIWLVVTIEVTHYSERSRSLNNTRRCVLCNAVSILLIHMYKYFTVAWYVLFV